MVYKPENNWNTPKKAEGSKSLETYRVHFQKGLAVLSQRVNEECGQKLLGADGVVRMEKFYADEKVRADRERMKEKKERWVRRDLKLDPHGPVTQEHLQEWDKKEAAKPRKGELLEMMATVLMHKVLKDDYVIARASKYDDYFGFDNIIVNKKTGAVVCTFDDVHDREGGSTQQEKIHEMLTSARKGGATIEYGFTFENGQLLKKRIEHVPKLYMPFDMDELDLALGAVNAEDLDTVTDKELAIYNSIIDKFAAELPQLLKEATDKEYLKNVREFAEALPGLKK